MDPFTFTTPSSLHVQVKIPSGILRVRTDAESDATELVFERVKDPKDLNIRLDETGAGHRLVIEHRGSKLGLFSGADIVLTLRCPARATIEMSGGSADLSVQGEIGGIDFSSGSGDVAFEDCAGEVRVKVGSGDVVGGRVGGAFSMHGASGDVSLAAVAGSFEVKTASGDVGVRAIDGDVSLTSVSGDIDLASLRDGRAQIRSVSGDVHVGVAAGTDVYLDLHATNGDTRSDLNMVEGPVEGGRTLELKVATVSGDIRVGRAPAREHV